MDGVVQLGFFVVLLAIGLFVGRANERKHFRELAGSRRELARHRRVQRTRPRRSEARSAAARSSSARS